MSCPPEFRNAFARAGERVRIAQDRLAAPDGHMDDCALDDYRAAMRDYSALELRKTEAGRLKNKVVD